MARISAPQALVLGSEARLGVKWCCLGHLAHAFDLAHPHLPRGEQVDLPTPVLRDDRGRRLPLRLLKDLHGQCVAGLNRALGAQRSMGHPGSVHRYLLPSDSEQVSGRRLRDTDPYWWRDHIHMGWPQTYGARSGRATPERREQRSSSRELGGSVRGRVGLQPHGR